MSGNTDRTGNQQEVCRLLVVAHDAMLYGAQRSLLDLLGGIDRRRFEPYVVIPSAGPFTAALDKLRIPFAIGLVQRWIFFPKPMSWRAILRRPWRRLNHPYLLALLSWLSLPVRVALLARVIRRRRIALVYTNTATVIDGALAARLCGVPHVWHLREAVAGNSDLASPLPVGWLPSFALKHSASVIVNSRALARLLFDPMPPGKVRVIHNGIDLARFAGTQPAPPLPPLPAQARLAAVCGSLQERKDILTYLRAAARLRDGHPELHHLLIGQGHGEYLSRLQREIGHLGLADRVHLLGHRDDIAALFARVDIVVSTAVAEPFGRTLVEAMAAGKPVIATRSGGPEEIVVDGECGFLIDIGDDSVLALRLKILLEDADLYARLSHSARERAISRFSLDVCIGRILERFDTCFSDIPPT